ncbi:MAG: hypothetical protein M0D57_18735 [Sphingobacteriales bacterium JAD_PAG50586_3]|nr:MAG: hypothetical protein M0D57_18735 [Sphingobacteriales bacterium JAD_PAG50586_3]
MEKYDFEPEQDSYFFFIEVVDWQWLLTLIIIIGLSIYFIIRNKRKKI